MQPKPASFLLRELLAAHRRAREADVAAALAVCGLRTDEIVWGVEFVTVDNHHYEPTPTGRAAVIIPHFDGGDLCDLVAVGLGTHTSRTRLGICTVLGNEWLDWSREMAEPVAIFANPIAWLRQGRRGACLIDWRVARHALADVPAVHCDKPLAARIDKAMRQPVHLPRLIVRQDQHRRGASSTQQGSELTRAA